VKSGSRPFSARRLPHSRCRSRDDRRLPERGRRAFAPGRLRS
jgi:hypothetical protein